MGPEMGASPWVVHKLGGTSLGSAERFELAGAFLGARGEPRQAVVVSAMAGITDQLLGLVGRATERGLVPDAQGVLGRARAAIDALIPGPSRQALHAALDVEAQVLADLLAAAARLKSAEPTLVALVAGMGEQWSARLLAAHLSHRGQPAVALDAREVLFLDRDGNVDENRSRAAWKRWHAGQGSPSTVVITGFVATTADGRATTLGRNGSDHSATLFGRLLDASEVVIWTDVAGVLTADPRRVPGARRVPVLSYAEAMELAYFGAKVLHPKTMAPLIAGSIPVSIQSALEPEALGTRIDAAGAGGDPVKAITTIEGMALVEVAGGGLIGVPGIARRLFGQLEAGGISVVLISQASSEHSICFSVPEAEAARAEGLVNEAFYAERHRGLVEPARVHRGLAIIALVGDGMSGRPGVSARAFGALGRAGINVRAIAQGASERNLSVVVEAKEATRALRAVHAGFWLSRPSLSIAIVGLGNVGKTLLAQLAKTQSRLWETAGVELRVRGLARSGQMWLGEPELALDRSVLDERGEPARLDGLVEHLLADGAPHAAIVDATASEALADQYAGWLDRGVHVVTANKRAGAGPRDRFDRIRAAARDRGRFFLYETTVGAGLPVLGTVRDLVETGDRIHRVEGMLSGTLGWLLSSWDGGPFSEVAREAHRRGYTEPDLRDDLSGMDVARKLVILAREARLPLELSDVAVEGLVPPELQALGAGEVLDHLEALDAPMSSRRMDGRVLRFVGTLEAGEARVRLESLLPTHPFAQARGTDNVVLVTSDRYQERPLVVQGPGAGPEVTAGGLFAELIRLARAVGA